MTTSGADQQWAISKWNAGRWVDEQPQTDYRFLYFMQRMLEAQSNVIISYNLANHHSRKAHHGYVHWTQPNSSTVNVLPTVYGRILLFLLYSTKMNEAETVIMFSHTHRTVLGQVICCAHLLT